LLPVGLVDEIHEDIVRPFDRVRVINRATVCVPFVCIGKVELVFALGTLCSIPLFGRDFCGDIFRAFRTGSIWSYGRVWRDLTRWSVLGLVTTEMTVNAHVYLVTFISGSQALALIAAAALFTRPVALVMAALPDREGPALARLLADRNWRKADRNLMEFRVVIATLWIANLVLAVAVLVFVPELVVKKGYDVHTFVAVVAIWLTITAVRGARAPDSLFLLAARAFRPLAHGSVVSSIVAFTVTLALLLIFNPVLSLFGILAGDIALWFMLHASARALKHDLSNHPSRDGDIRSAFAG
jgi:hypothetical protein